MGRPSVVVEVLDTDQVRIEVNGRNLSASPGFTDPDSSSTRPRPSACTSGLSRAEPPLPRRSSIKAPCDPDWFTQAGKNSVCPGRRSSSNPAFAESHVAGLRPPVSRARMGSPRTINATRAAKGLPGKPSTTVAPILPSRAGLPGFMSKAAYSHRPPASSRARRVWSASPPAIPPLVMIRSASAASSVSNAVARSRSSPARTVSTIRHEGRCVKAVAIDVLASKMWPGCNSAPGFSSSAPKAAMAMRTRGTVRTSGSPQAASRAICRVSSTVPA